MRKFLKHQFLWQKKANLHYLIPMLGTIIFVAVTISAIFLNTFELEKQLTTYSESYARDVSKQLSGRIYTRLHHQIYEITQLAESFASMPDHVITEDLLEKKKTLLELSELFILNPDGSTMPETLNHNVLQSTLPMHTQISFTEQNQVIISTPIHKDSAYPQLLVSLCSEETLQDMLNDFDFNNNGRCCILNKEGKIVIASENLLPSEELHSVFNHASSAQDRDTAQTVLSDIQNNRSNIVIFHDVIGEELIVGYDFLGINDWMLFTVLPHNLFSDIIHEHMIQYILIAILLCVASLLILIVIMRLYRKHMSQIKEIALTDEITGGDSDKAFRMRGEYLLNEYPQQNWAIIYLNNKNFKNFNLLFGIDGANEILKSIHDLLKCQLNSDECIARCDGTSFCLFLEYVDKESLSSRLNSIVDCIHTELLKKYALENYHLMQGAYLITDRTHHFMQMQDWAKIASSYQQANETCKFFDNSIIQILKKDQQLEEHFKQALQRHEFKLYIQPKVNPNNDQVLGGEVLVRWEHPSYGLLMPNQFIPLLEKNGDICDLDFYMFEETCKLIHRWEEAGTPLALSVNLSRSHFGAGNLNFIKHFQKLKEQYRIPDGRLEFELTESLLLEPDETLLVLEFIDRIRKLGFLCSIDDFGFGYSSLSLLKDLNVNILKLDRQFFLNENNKSWIVIAQFIRLAHQLNMSVVAEGIEDLEQVEKLRVYRCDLIQGYVYSKPLVVSDFEIWFKEYMK